MHFFLTAVSERWRSNISAKYQSMTFHGPSTTELKNAQLVSVFLMDEISVLERQMKVRKAKERL